MIAPLARKAPTPWRSQDRATTHSPVKSAAMKHRDGMMQAIDRRRKYGGHCRVCPQIALAVLAPDYFEFGDYLSGAIG
jgi:hypothetical protein